MFSIAYGLVLWPLPYPDPESIVHVGERYGGRGRGTRLTNRSMPVLQDAESFEGLAVYRESSVEWAGPDGVVTLSGANGLALACSPCCGRRPAPRPALHRRRKAREERRPGRAAEPPRLDRTASPSDPDIVGAPLELDGDVLHRRRRASRRGSISRTPTASSGRRSSSPRSCAAGGGRRRGQTAHDRDHDRLQRPSAASRRGSRRSRRPTEVQHPPAEPAASMSFGRLARGHGPGRRATRSAGSRGAGRAAAGGDGGRVPAGADWP